MTRRQMGRGADITRLRYFVAACEYGGFSKAANEIGVAQPAVTRQVRLLEDDLGVSLFTRNGRDAVPTQAGAYLLKEARPYLEGLDGLIDSMRGDSARPTGAIRFGVCPSIAPLFLEPEGSRILDSSVNHSIRVIEAYSGELHSLMSTGNLDLALTYSQNADDSQEVMDLLSERLAVAARRAPSGSTLRVQDLAKLDLILPSRRHQLRRIIDAVAETRQIDLTPALELDSIPAVMAMLGDADCVYSTILPFHSVAATAANDHVAIRVIDDPDMVRTIALAKPKSGVCSVPGDLVESIVIRAKTITATMRAVF